jgi:hypothetical protein
MLGQGPGVPTAEALRQMLGQSNVQTKADILRRFIREHPAQFEAKNLLLWELKRIAEQKTKDALGEDAGKNTKRLLSNEEDLAIWGEFATLFSQMLAYRIEQTREQFFLPVSSFLSNFYYHSPSMKIAARSLLPKVEAGIKRQPASLESNFLWPIWCALSDLLELNTFVVLKDSLVLSPSNGKLDAPPRESINWMLDQYHARSNWQGIIDLQAWRWDALLENRANLTQYYWTYEFSKLLEAYLRLGKNREATDLVIAWIQSTVWEQVKKSAAELAEKFGRPELAEQWKKH